ncbi:PRC-barrel domain-containing protein [Palleronia sediminis]|nr:PRC-barrel domain-containing protein [Palleronia sediminis]
MAALMIGGAVSAQTMDISNLRSIDDADLYGPEGNKIGEVEEILVDETGTPVAAAIEFGGFLDIGDDDVVIMLEDMTYENGNFSTSLTEDQLGQLPSWDD